MPWSCVYRHVDEDNRKKRFTKTIYFCANSRNICKTGIEYFGIFCLSNRWLLVSCPYDQIWYVRVHWTGKKERPKAFRSIWKTRLIYYLKYDKYMKDKT